MKKSKFTEAQIVFAIKQSETGTRVEEICRQLGISQATFFNWKKKFGGLGVSELRKLRQLEEENDQLKKLVADLSLDKQMIQEVIKKNYKGPLQKRDGRLDDNQLPYFGTKGLPVRHACQINVLLQTPSPG